MQTSITKQIKHLFLKELRVEFKNRYALWSLLLMLIIAVFVIYTIQKEATNLMWHSLFYVILIFGIIQNITRSFLHEKKGNLLYYRFLVDGKALIIAKVLYQFLVNTFFLVMLFILMNFWLPQSIPFLIDYGITAWLFMLCNVTVFTFNSALALNARNSSLVATILSMPLLIPSLLISLKSASKTMSSIDHDGYYQDWVVLILLLITQCVLSISLFNYVWKD